MEELKIKIKYRHKNNDMSLWTWTVFDPQKASSSYGLAQGETWDLFGGRSRAIRRAKRAAAKLASNTTEVLTFTPELKGLTALEERTARLEKELDL